MSIKISLIIPVYNVEGYIEKCLNSAINQTMKDIEIIVIDDGSTDNSLKICTNFASKDSRIKLISQTNTGLGGARNKGLLHAKGQYILFLDSDDWLAPETLKTCYQKAEKDESDIVIFGFERIDEKSFLTKQIRDDLDFDPHTSKDEFVQRVFSGKLKLMACAMMARKHLFLEHNLLFPSTLHEDLYVMPEIYYFAKKVSIIKTPFYKWLIRADSITNTITQKHIDGIVTAIYSLKIFMLRQHIYQKYQVEFTLFSIRYLNLLYQRIKSFKVDAAQKESLNQIMSSFAIQIINFDLIKDIPNSELSKFEEFISFIKEIRSLSLHSEKTELIKINKKLISDIVRIKNSRGYKVLLRYYKLQNILIPKNSYRRQTLVTTIKSTMQMYRTSSSLIQSSLSLIKTKIFSKQYYDIVFIPHKDYHVWTMGLIAENLKKVGISSCMIDLTDHYRDEGSRQKAKEFSDIPFLDYSLLRDNLIHFKAIICMNDWDTKIVRPEILKAQKNNKKTIGIIEGINDFYDKDVKHDRHAYKTVEYLLLTGEHDQQFFPEKKGKTYIIGVPRLKELLDEVVIFPKNPIAVINMNFSYNVLTEYAEYWLQSAIEGCEKAGIDYVITHHPADKTDLSHYNVSALDMYETIRNGSILISRFSSAILESLALGKPVVYHNPHHEKALKFQEPLNAYSLSFDSDSLAKAIQYELTLKTDYRVRANQFLDFHCNINAEKSSLELSMESIRNILNL